jgi:hypothetical protein
MFTLASLRVTRSDSSSSVTASLAPSLSSDPPQDAEFHISDSSSFGSHRCRSEPPTPLLRSCLKVKSQGDSLRESYGSSSCGIRGSIIGSLSPRSLVSPISSPSSKAKRQAAHKENVDKNLAHRFDLIDTISSFFRRVSEHQRSVSDKTDTSQDADLGVHFAKVSIREYNLDVGVHPNVSCGPAVTLGWNYDDSIQDMNINEYELLRADEHRRRGPFRELSLSSAERIRRLRRSGITNTEIEECMFLVEKAKLERIQTLERLQRGPVGLLLEERLESVAKSLKTALGLRKRQKKAEEKLWADAETYFALKA